MSVCIFIFHRQNNIEYIDFVSLNTPIFEDNCFSSKLCHRIKWQHWVTFVWGRGFGFHFVRIRVLSCIMISGWSCIRKSVIKKTQNLTGKLYQEWKCTHHRETVFPPHHPQTRGTPQCRSRWGTSGPLGRWSEPNQGRGQTHGRPPEIDCTLDMGAEQWDWVGLYIGAEQWYWIGLQIWEQSNGTELDSNGTELYSRYSRSRAMGLSWAGGF